MINSKLRITNFLKLLGIAGLSVLVYLIYSYSTFSIGFPLDDAWIHQTYARNLGLHGEWAYFTNQPSAGSTSPLWSTLLSIGYFLRLNPFLWTFALGFLILGAIACIGVSTYHKMVTNNPKWGLWVGVLLIFEWHLVWAALSGMETGLFSALVLITFTWLIAGWERWFWLGVVVGLGVWVRPDGLTLIGPTLLVLLLSKSSLRSKLISTLHFVLGTILLLVPYLGMNSALSGSIWPNTFYAKQTEYAIELSHPLWWRLYEQFQLPLVGVGVILVPGFIWCVWLALRERKWPIFFGAVWAIGYLVLYALRLPVNYQHGRYAMPMMPVYYVWSFSGTVMWLKLNSPILWRRIISRSTVIAGSLILLVFWVLGGRAYARDVAVIETEMVATARWIQSNTGSDSLIAAHDIGALGYFSNRPLLDLAGLVSPAVIPIVRNEPRLAELLDEENVDYLVTFPGWYPLLVERAVPVYQTGAPFAPELGAENMIVYRWHRLTGK